MMDQYAPFLLDTNIYALFFQRNPPPAFDKLLTKIQCDSVSTFYIPEIVSMEIHSVLGKYRRSGVRAQEQPCNRQIKTAISTQSCAHTFITEAKVGIKPKVFKAMCKLVTDIEEGRGSIKAQIIPLRSSAITYGKDVLTNYADKYSFGSHDALVAGTLLAAREQGLMLTLVTADKGLKAACRDMGIAFFDPNQPDTTA